MAATADGTIEKQPLLVSLRNKLDCEPTSTEKPSLILASQSPRRREILGMMGLVEGKEYLVEPSPLDESQLQVELRGNVSPIEYTRKLAEAKAFALAEAHASQSGGERDNNNNKVRYYLGSDTIVELNESILEKPKDKEDAKRMLRSMSGCEHHVHTGVALYRLGSDSDSNSDSSTPTLLDSFTDTACVMFTDLTEEDIDAYILSGEPMDKAGSYGIQGIGGQFVTEISGDFFTVMGLPMHKTSKLIANALRVE